MYSSKSDIPSFYSDRSVLITGATGFIGSVLLEKLLRSCPGLKTVFILIRGKRTKDERQRLKELFDSPVFDKLKNEDPSVLHKVTAVIGELSRADLGISASDLTMLREEVSVIFHSAATVKFDEPLKKAVELNVLALRRLLEVCQSMPKLEALVHVSTAFSNLNRPKIDEILYPPPIQPQKIIDITKWMSSDMLDLITPKLLGDLPNTYTFTKALGETLVVEECGKVPVTIIRPSIVTAACKEPHPGWISSFSGPAGIFVAVGKGVLRSMTVHEEKAGDFIPVDFVSNLMIATGWYTATYRPNNVMIFNSTSYDMNRETWGNMMKCAYPTIMENFKRNIFLFPSFTSRRNRGYFTFSELVRVNPVAQVIDIFASLTRAKKAKQKVKEFAESYEYVTTSEWNFSCNNVFMLNDLMSPEDQKTFYIDLRELDWSRYWENHVIGCKKYLLKDDDSSEEKQGIRKEYIIGTSVFILLTVGAWKFGGTTSFSNTIKTGLTAIPLPFR